MSLGTSAFYRNLIKATKNYKKRRDVGASKMDEVEATALGSAVGKKAGLTLAFILIIYFKGTFFRGSPKIKLYIPSTSTKSLFGETEHKHKFFKVHLSLTAAISK